MSNWLNILNSIFIWYGNSKKNIFIKEKERKSLKIGINILNFFVMTSNCVKQILDIC